MKFVFHLFLPPTSEKVDAHVTWEKSVYKLTGLVFWVNSEINTQWFDVGFI